MRTVIINESLSERDVRAVQLNFVGTNPEVGLPDQTGDTVEFEDTELDFEVSESSSI